MVPEFRSNFNNIEPCLLMAAAARQTIRSEHTAVGSHCKQNVWKRGIYRFSNHRFLL